MTAHFSYRDNRLLAEEIPVAELAALYGTPLYVYSRAAITERFRAWHQPMGHRGLVCYAVKANSNLAVLNVLARLGSGFDIVSQGELERVLLAGGQPDKIIFSGVGKTAVEMRRALDVGIRCFNVESEAELHELNRVAGELGKRAPISLRVNPDVDAQTHPYISTGLRENKFGVDIREAVRLYRDAAALPHLQVVGVDCHIGSQLTTLAPFFDAVDRVLALVDELERFNIRLHHIDLGGGLGVTYRDETPPDPSEYLQGIFERLGSRSQEIMVEPGRSIVANAGILLTKVEYLKQTDSHHFAIVDAAMNDLIRPALYQAWMNITSVEMGKGGTTASWDIVGPVCETGDFLGKQRELTLCADDLLCIHSAGAYGFTMSSNYNSRPRAAEVMVDGARHSLIRRRESLVDLYAHESVLQD